MKNFIKNLICDAEGIPSCTTFLAVSGFVFFIIVTSFLLFQNRTWAHYEVFTGTLLTACFGAQVTGKYINSRTGNSSGKV